MTCPYLQEFCLFGVLKGTSCTAYENGKLRTPTFFEQNVYCRSERYIGCLTYQCRLMAEGTDYWNEEADLFIEAGG